MRATLLGWADWIIATPLNNWIAIHEWVVPLSQSIHIMAVGIIFSSALVINMRLLGVGKSSRTVSQLTIALTPWMYGALVTLLITGAIQIIAEPVRQFVTPAFWWKMAMIVVVVALTTWFIAAVRRRAAVWDIPADRPALGAIFSVVSMVLWIGVIFCGRFIGYTWNFYV